MRHFVILKVLGVLLTLFSFSMLPPVLVSFIYHQRDVDGFLTAFSLTFLVGLFLWFVFRRQQAELRPRDGFIIVGVFWVVLSFFGSLPFFFDQHMNLTFTNAFFESSSGLTTTGATIMSRISQLSYSIQFYRQELQFIGGMGIIVLAVAVLPMLGVGGMQLYRAETPGPMKDKLKPRIQETAKAMWLIYVGLTVSCTVLFWFSGLDFFHALGESFSTVSTGGFSMHDTSFAFYQNNFLDLIAVVFMLLSAFNFALHYAAISGRSLKVYFNDSELKAYFFLILVVFLITSTMLIIHQTYTSTGDLVINSLFNVVSLATTTGLTTSEFSFWPSFVPLMMVLTGVIGGCAASTAGGIKVIRLTLLYKQVQREIIQLIHPCSLVTVKLGKEPVEERITHAVWSFISLFFAVFFVLLMLLVATGLDFQTAFAALTACMSNTAEGLNNIASKYETLSASSKWVLIFAMYVGRLEVFTILVLFSPAFWRR
jgi:trk system potassium uptake protein TrkH